MGIIYLGYNSGTPIASGNPIPMTTIIRKKCFPMNTNLVLKGEGYYKVTVNANLASTAGGNAVITLNQNNAEIANATETIAADGTVSISFSAVVRNTCCNPNSNLSIVYTGPVLTSTFCSVIVENA